MRNASSVDITQTQFSVHRILISLYSSNWRSLGLFRRVSRLKKFQTIFSNHVYSKSLPYSRGTLYHCARRKWHECLTGSRSSYGIQLTILSDLARLLQTYPIGYDGKVRIVFFLIIFVLKFEYLKVRMILFCLGSSPYIGWMAIYALPRWAAPVSAYTCHMRAKQKPQR